ncbi:MAG: hypothetical protein MUF06_16275 [Pirellulaceae bacterium]|jgi:hypothetical protein|nr:hypothetical protein [Pirellulaceae bacterium]
MAAGGCGSRTPSSRSADVAPQPANEQPAATELPDTAGLRTVTWEELDLGMEPDSVYQPWMMKTSVAELVGKPIRITGFMCGAIFQKENVRNFPLLRERECPFGVGGQAHHVIEVDLPQDLRTSFTTEPVTIEGTFSVRPWTGPNGKTWSLYHVKGTKVERGALADVSPAGAHAAAEAD